MRVEQNGFGGHDILNNMGNKIGKIDKVGNQYKISGNGIYKGYIKPEMFKQEYRAYNSRGEEIGKGLFEVLLSLFFN